MGLRDSEHCREEYRSAPRSLNMVKIRVELTDPVLRSAKGLFLFLTSIEILDNLLGMVMWQLSLSQALTHACIQRGQNFIRYYVIINVVVRHIR